MDPSLRKTDLRVRGSIRSPSQFPEISTRVNKPENDDPSVLEPIQLASDAA
jgi:hypothetical protein